MKNNYTEQELVYELNVSPRASLYSLPDEDSMHKAPPSDTSAQQPSSSAPSNTPHAIPPPPATLSLLFSLLSRRHRTLVLLPSILTSMVAGGIAPFMTFVIGQAFDAFAAFSTSALPIDAARALLLHDVGVAALELVGLAAGSFALGSLNSALWIWTGEVNARAVRVRVYEAVAAKEMAWFDRRMGNGNGNGQEGGERDTEDGPIGAGGMMAKFSRDTEDIRTASSLASGTVIQYLTTVLASLLLAFTRSYQLTLVILAGLPLLILVQALAQTLAAPRLAAERTETARAATLVERAVAAIATVKAFNAAPVHLAAARASFRVLDKQARGLNGIWSASSGVAQAAAMCMFVQGFWFGGKLVREGRAGAGDVMSVFWACLIASTNLQMCIPQLVVLAKGRAAMSALIALTVPSPGYGSPSTGGSAYSAGRTRTVRGIRPARCRGEVALHNVSFAYPGSGARQHVPVLKGVSLFLPAGEMTFIVGGSGSGKSTVAALIGGMYAVGGDGSSGMVALDEQDVRFLDAAFVREHVAVVAQAGGAGTVILSGRTVLENLLMAVSSSSSTTTTTTSAAAASSSSSSSPASSTTTTTSSSASSPVTWTRAEMEQRAEEALRMAMLHDWVHGLENGLDEVLGGDASAQCGGNGDGDGEDEDEDGFVQVKKGGGVGLSGGQKQRLALARARLRDPTVLVLDEATSALDHTTRLLVFAALRRWRANKTTIVITHDLSQIEGADFVYVMKRGRVVEQGYRGDLERVGVASKDKDTASNDKDNASNDKAASVYSDSETDGRGEFRTMMEAQAQTGGFLPVKEEDAEAAAPPALQFGEEFEEEFEEEEKAEEELVQAPLQTHLRPLTFGNWMFEVVADLTGVRPAAPAPASTTTFPAASELSSLPQAHLSMHGAKKPRPKSIQILDMPLTAVSPLSARRMSLPFTPTSPSSYVNAFGPLSPASTATVVDTASRKSGAFGYSVKEEGESDEEDDDASFENEKRAMDRTGRTAKGARGPRRAWPAGAHGKVVEVKVSSPHDKPAHEEHDFDDEAQPAFWKLMRDVWPTVPSKPALFVGFAFAVLSGAMTPLFSFLLSRLMFEVSVGAQNVSAINMFGGLVLAAAALDGLFLGAKYLVMETVAMRWVTRLRGAALERVLAQDKRWFDRPRHAAPRLTQVLVRDGDDARNLIAVVWTQCLVVVTMLGVGLIWALVRGWQLTLAGFAIAPVFAVVMAVQTKLVARCEVRNKRARESVARAYYEMLINVRGIRSMGFERVFREEFDRSADRALRTGVRGAFVEGCTYGIASGLIYLAEALLFYVGAVLIARGTYSYLQMVEVLNLVVFSVSIGSQLMAFTERIAKAVQATADFNRLLNLDTKTQESQGKLCPDLTNNTDITFNHVDFSYPENPSVPVLKDVSLSIRSGECVAIVGASGSGKSTLAALLQRLYEPTYGNIELGSNRLGDIDVHHLREHVSVVSQQPNLFDATIAENIRYGTGSNKQDPNWVDDFALRRAAKQANVHDFIMDLPDRYNTMVGENAALISGGQAQRLQIARALVRPARVLILDECTSALDAENQAAVLETIAGIAARSRRGSRRTTVMVTHKLQVMRMCDRIVVLQDGEVREQGTYEELLDRKGVFATLASGGEWVGE